MFGYSSSYPTKEWRKSMAGGKGSRSSCYQVIFATATDDRRGSHQVRWKMPNLAVWMVNLSELLSSAEALEPCDDEEKNARMKKRIQDQLAKLKRNAERRRQRQLAKQAALAENPVLGLIRGKREGAMRRCGNCGQLGHMKTNKNCPMFYVVNGQQNNPNNQNNNNSNDNDNNNNNETPSSQLFNNADAAVSS